MHVCDHQSNDGQNRSKHLIFVNTGIILVLQVTVHHSDELQEGLVQKEHLQMVFRIPSYCSWTFLMTFPHWKHCNINLHVLNPNSNCRHSCHCFFPGCTYTLGWWLKHIMSSLSAVFSAALCLFVFFSFYAILHIFLFLSWK